MSELLIAGLFTILGAIVGAGITHLSSKRLLNEQKKMHKEAIEAQRELFKRERDAQLALFGRQIKHDQEMYKTAKQDKREEKTEEAYTRMLEKIYE